MVHRSRFLQEIQSILCARILWRQADLREAYVAGRSKCVDGTVLMTAVVRLLSDRAQPNDLGKIAECSTSLQIAVTAGGHVLGDGVQSYTALRCTIHI